MEVIVADRRHDPGIASSMRFITNGFLLYPPCPPFYKIDERGEELAKRVTCFLVSALVKHKSF